MLKLVALKQKQAKENRRNERDANDTEEMPALSSNGMQTLDKQVRVVGTVATASQLRLQRDISELDTGATMSIEFPDPSDIMHFQVILVPDEGFYRGGQFRFAFEVPAAYPHAPPRVRCLTKIFHPNIDDDGNICLNILREEWKPVLSLNSVLYGLQYLFLELNAEDALNKEAAHWLEHDKCVFRDRVNRRMRESRGMNPYSGGYR